MTRAYRCKHTGAPLQALQVGVDFRMLHLIHNPAAGRGRGRRAGVRVRDALSALGAEATLWTTEAPGHATCIVQGLPTGATVVAIGGDGTLHEVVLACLHGSRTVGVVPFGSGDDFAHALGLPRLNFEPAVRALLHGTVREVDTGVCNGVPFVNALGVGFDAEVGARVSEAPRPLTGLGAYLWSVTVCLRDLRTAEVRLELDGDPAYEGPSLLVTTQNGPRTGGSFRFAPDAQVDDGWFDVVYATRVTRTGVLSLLPKVMRGRHAGDPRVRFGRARSVRMVWDRPRTWHAEGEIQAPCDRFDIRVRPASLRILAP